MAVLAAVNWRNELDTLNERMGELRDAPNGVGAWARLYGSENEYGDQNVNAKNATVQVGADCTLGDWTVGAAFSYTDGESTYDAGEADNEAYGVAFYGAWMHQSGQYVDLVAKYSRMSQDFALDGMDGSYDNNAYAFSIEYGWRFEPTDLTFVEPQAQLTYARIDGDRFKSANGVDISQDDFQSIIGRIGVRGGFKFPNKKGTLYARASVLHDVDGEMEADVRATSGNARNEIFEDLGGTWFEYGIGANFRLSDATCTYLDLERSSGGEVDEKWRWNVGIRHVF